MTHQRRAAITMGFLIAAVAMPIQAADYHGDWPDAAERVWAGPELWTNPLTDWRVDGGRLECVISGGDRSVQLLTHDLADRDGAFTMRVTLGRLGTVEPLTPGWAGFEVGGRGQFADHRDSAVHGHGLKCGVDHLGRPFIGYLAADAAGSDVLAGDAPLTLTVSAAPVADAHEISLEVHSQSGELRGRVSRQVPSDWLVGQVALVTSSGAAEGGNDGRMRFGNGRKRGGSWRVWFDDWMLGGEKVDAHPERAFGPVLFTMYTLSDGILKLTAQMPPLGNESRQVALQLGNASSGWSTIDLATIDPLARTATFRIESWDATRDVPYRVVHHLRDASGVPQPHGYEGVIRRDPVDRSPLEVAVLTCNNDLGFPNHDLFQHIEARDPDLFLFLGDQIYEGVGGYGCRRGAPLPFLCLEYLRKWYLFGWAYRDLLRDRPTVAIPDDHDVLQGNIWGAGGRAADLSLGQVNAQASGGYVEHPAFVRMVERTQTSHLPDAYDPTPVEQGIGVYYTAMRYGRVSFAIIEDRKFKSGPMTALPDAEIWNGWSQKEDFDATIEADPEGATLLGERQLAFLHAWAADWSGDAHLKCVLSQTIFANVATLPEGAASGAVIPRLPIPEPGEYPENEFPAADLDSNGWPPSARNRALRAIRSGFAIHLAGDQHLGSFITYGIDEHGDAGDAFCVPAISNVWPRRWFPHDEPVRRPDGAPRYAGDFLDGFGNLMTVHAVSNPVRTGRKPVNLHDRATGFGYVVFDTDAQTITAEGWSRYGEQYPGWPITVELLDQYRPAPHGHLPTIDVSGLDAPVFQVIRSDDEEIIYTVRLTTSRFRPPVYAPGNYVVRVGDPDAGRWQTTGTLAPETGESSRIRLEF